MGFQTVSWLLKSALLLSQDPGTDPKRALPGLSDPSIPFHGKKKDTKSDLSIITTTNSTPHLQFSIPTPELVSNPSNSQISQTNQLKPTSFSAWLFGSDVLSLSAHLPLLENKKLM